MVEGSAKEESNVNKDATPPKTRRGYAKSSLTKQLASLQRATAERNSTKIQETLRKCSLAFDKFEALHEECGKGLGESESQDEWSFFAAENDAYIEIVTKANATLAELETPSPQKPVAAACLSRSRFAIR
jgi:hypothetical protein